MPGPTLPANPTSPASQIRPAKRPNPIPPVRIVEIPKDEITIQKIQGINRFLQAIGPVGADQKNLWERFEFVADQYNKAHRDPEFGKKMQDQRDKALSDFFKAGGKKEWLPFNSDGSLDLSRGAFAQKAEENKAHFDANPEDKKKFDALKVSLVDKDPLNPHVEMYNEHLGMVSKAYSACLAQNVNPFLLDHKRIRSIDPRKDPLELELKAKPGEKPERYRLVRVGPNPPGVKGVNINYRLPKPYQIEYNPASGVVPGQASATPVVAANVQPDATVTTIAKPAEVSVSQEIPPSAVQPADTTSEVPKPPSALTEEPASGSALLADSKSVLEPGEHVADAPVPPLESEVPQISSGATV
jgi:hypothetical protein